MRSVAVVAMLAATFHLADPAGCSATPTLKDCNFTYHGVYLKGSEVFDVVTPVCDAPPVKHAIDVWFEYKPVESWDWEPYGRHAVSATIPDKAGFPLEVRMPCLAGWYHTRVHVKGRSPADDKNPGGIPFDFSDTGAEKHFTAEQCQGG